MINFKLRNDFPMLPLIVIGSLLVLVLVWFSSLPLRTSYPNLVVESTYLEDPSGLETFETVQSRSFTAYQGPLFLGNKLRPIWLKLTLAPSSQPDWVVMFQPNFIHHIETWTPLEGGGWHHSVVGIKHAFNSRDIKAVVPSVATQPSPDLQTVIYVKVVSPTTPLYAQVISAKDAREFDSLIYLVGGVFMGIGVLVGLVSFMVFVATRDSLWLLDSAYNLIGLVVLSLHLGIFSPLVVPTSQGLVDQLNLFGNVIFVVLTSLLYYRIFGLFTLSRWFTLPNLLAPVVSVYLIWLIIQGHADQAMAINNSLVFFLSSLGFLIVFYARHPDRPLLMTFRFFYIMSISYFMWWSISVVLQRQTENFAALYPGFPVALFSLLMLTLILVRNTQLKIQHALRVEMQRQQVERDLELARMRHEETNSFYGMLLHEVKNPLSTIRMAIGNLENSLMDQDESVQKRLKRVQDSVDHVDEVLKRGLAVDILEQGALVLNLQPVDLASLIDKACKIHPEAERLHVAANKVQPVIADEHLLYLMVGNLLDNAAKYSASGSRIDVSLEYVAYGSFVSQVQLVVSNQPGAAGVPNADKVFSKYYRSASAMRIASSGMGLGLYWVRGVARKMGGDALYEQDQGKVVFKLCLPI